MTEERAKFDRPIAVPKMYPIRGHKFRESKISGIPVCSICDQYLWLQQVFLFICTQFLGGKIYFYLHILNHYSCFTLSTYQGVRCDHCQMVTHKKCCQNVLTDCLGTPHFQLNNFEEKAKFKISLKHNFLEKKVLYI